MNQTSFALVYDSFLSKITDDMYMELTELDTYRMLEQLLLSAIDKFEFPRINLQDYELLSIVDQRPYSGVESNNQTVAALVYEDGYFNNYLTHEEINVLAIYMAVEWFSQQLASIENTRMKYSGPDFKFTSQANHMAKILQLKKDFQREGFHMQRLYKRHIQDRRGIMRSTFGIIMQPLNTDFVETSKKNRNIISYEELINKPSIESVELSNNKDFPDLGLTRIDYDDLENIFT